MTETPESAKELAKIEHLEWAIAHRAQNQACCLRLLRLFVKRKGQWTSKRLARAAQDLLAAAFSLWRAAFLADKEGKRAAVFDDGVEFLKKVVADNTISFTQDRDSNEWTFNYYTRNARSSLEALSRHWPEQVPKYRGANRAPTSRWEYCQELLDVAVGNFEKLLSEEETQRENSQLHRERRKAAKERRKKSRSVSRSQKKT